jgi:hypothetical protein
MKKTWLLLYAVLAIHTVQAQGFYMRAGLGYMFPQAGQTLDGTGTPYNGTLGYDSIGTNYRLKSASFASGVEGVLAGGYLFSKHIGVDLSASLGVANRKYNLNATNVVIYGVASNLTQTTQAKNPIFLMPAIVLQTGGEPYNLYARFGLAVPLNTGLNQEQDAVNLPGTGATEAIDVSLRLKTSFTLGYTAAMGVSYKLSDQLSVFGEASLLSFSAYLKQSTITGASINGQSVSVPDSQKTVSYSKNISSHSSNLPTFSLPFSNVGFHFGIIYKFGEASSSVEEFEEKPKPGKFR